MRNNRNFRSSRFGRSQHGPTQFQRRPARKIQTIDPKLFVKKAEYLMEESYIPANAFTDFQLDSQVQVNIVNRGYNKPTAIQDQSIKPILEGKDLVGIANTGTGKTAAFLLPLITKIAQDRRQKVLIIAPTRELAIQIQDEFIQFSKGISLFSTLCIGGTSLYLQSKELSRNPNFVIGTPGRIKDLQKRRSLRLYEYTFVVLDEVDRMLDMGFIHDIRQIISLLPEKRQSLFFSATLPEETKRLMNDFLISPVSISVKTGATAKNIEQNVVKIADRNKLDVLHDLLISDGFEKVLVFGRTKWGINKLEKALKNRGFKTAAIHGNKTQKQRQQALQLLKANKVNILLATDVASRGLDIRDITHVINYDQPESYEDYVHRIGRTGRAGKKGIALTFV